MQFLAKSSYSVENIISHKHYNVKIYESLFGIRLQVCSSNICTYVPLGMSRRVCCETRVGFYGMSFLNAGYVSLTRLNNFYCFCVYKMLKDICALWFFMCAPFIIQNYDRVSLKHLRESFESTRELRRISAKDMTPWTYVIRLTRSRKSETP